MIEVIEVIEVIYFTVTTRTDVLTCFMKIRCSLHITFLTHFSTAYVIRGGSDRLRQFIFAVVAVEGFHTT